MQPWLTAKVLALIVYIGLGTVALKRGKTKAVKTTALLAALAVFTYIVAVALTRQVMISAIAMASIQAPTHLITV